MDEELTANILHKTIERPATYKLFHDAVYISEIIASASLTSAMKNFLLS